jgi:hypothetical protein
MLPVIPLRACPNKLPGHSKTNETTSATQSRALVVPRFDFLMPILIASLQIADIRGFPFGLCQF